MPTRGPTGFSAAFQFNDKSADLAPSDGSSWTDADLPEAVQCKSGAVGQIDWAVSGVGARKRVFVAAWPS